MPKTKSEIVASLPERFRRFEIPEPRYTLDDANLEAAYQACRYQELLKAFQKLVEKYS